MFFLTFCAGAEVRPREQDNVVITMWGGTEIILPTIAEKMMRIKKIKAEYGEINDSVIRRTNVITIMAGTVMKTPTLAKELEGMIQLRSSGAISAAEWNSIFHEALRRDDLDQFEALTLWGGFDEERPNLKEELKDLRMLASRGLISASEADELEKMLRVEPSTHQIQQKVNDLLLRSPETSSLAASMPFSSSKVLE